MSETTEFVEVHTQAGRVRGVWRGVPGSAEASAAFLGVPFAEPPVGDLRFAAPVPKAPWEGVLDALEFGATAQRGDPGVTLIPEPSVSGDSTLNVNVFTPSPTAPATGVGLPVLAWIHGGGYFAGSPASPWYDGRRFNRDGVVTVSISYRIGFNGFGWIADAPANRGVRDWLLALEWLQANITAFGGDPTRVTIAGQSAGGGAVQTLLGMEAAQHLFSSVYSISGATADIALPRAEQFGRDLAATLGVAPTFAGFSSVPEERMLDAQAEATKITAASFQTMITDGLALGPVVDGELIRRTTLDSYAQGVGADKPLVLGTTDDEFSMAFAGAAKKLRWVPRSFMLRKLGMPKGAMKPYLEANADVAHMGTARIAGRFLTDLMFRTSLVDTVAQRGSAPTWVYRFSWPSGVYGFAEHCIDVPFFFDCIDSPVAMDALTGPNPPQALADEIHGGAVTFVTGGSPGWPSYTAATRQTKVFDTPSSVVTDGYRGVRPLLSAC